MSIAPAAIRSRVINFVPCASGDDVNDGQASHGLINPAKGETAAGVWNKPSVRIPIQRGCTSVLFDRPYGAPLPARVIRYTPGNDPVSSKFHFDARSMSAALGFTWFEGWDETIERLTVEDGQRVIVYLGRPFPIFNTTQTPWSWPKNINDPEFQNCPGPVMRDLAYIRHQIPGVDHGLAEVFFDADGSSRSPTAGRYDTVYALSTILATAGANTSVDFDGGFYTPFPIVCGVEAMPPSDTGAWMAGRTGMSWLASSDGTNLDQAFDVRIGNPDFLQPDDMDAMPIVRFQGTTLADYLRAMWVLATFPTCRVAVKFYAMLQNGFDMAAMLAAGAVLPGDGDGDGDDSDDEQPADTCGAIGFAHSGCSGTIGVAKQCCEPNDDDDGGDNGGVDSADPGVNSPTVHGLAPDYVMVVGFDVEPDGSYISRDGPHGGGGHTPDNGHPDANSVDVDQFIIGLGADPEIAEPDPSPSLVSETVFVGGDAEALFVPALPVTELSEQYNHITVTTA